MSLRSSRILHCTRVSSPFRPLTLRPSQLQGHQPHQQHQKQHYHPLHINHHNQSYPYPFNPAASDFPFRCRRRWRSTSSSLGRTRYVTSGFNTSYIAVAVVSVASIVAFYAWPSSKESEAEYEYEEEDYITMSDEEIPPGHLGNLSTEQEAKLREMWYQLFKVGGMLPADMPAESTFTPIVTPDSSSVRDDGASTMTKKSKKRFGFGRKSNAEEAPADDDKHGQKQDYEQALKDQTPEQLRATIWTFVKADNPDALLLRFLRARKWNVQRALIMMISTVHWRGQVIKLDDDLIFKGEEWFARQDREGSGHDQQLGHDFMAQIRMGKSFVHGCDYQERPLVFIRVKLHHGGDQLAESIEKYTVYTIETARMMMKGRNETAVVVFDMTGFGIANMDYTPVKFMIKCFEANYPECLGAVCVFRSPWIFNTFWNIIKGWLDPVVASKIHFTKDAKELSQYIPMERIPKELGGGEDWDYSHIEPVEGENWLLHEAGEPERARLQKDRLSLVQQYEAATVDWIKRAGKNDQSERERRSDLAEKLRVSYWKLDPYLRARTVYDREGVIAGGGKVDFYPPKQAAQKAAAPAVATTNGGDYNARNSIDAQSIYYDAQEEFD